MPVRVVKGPNVLKQFLVEMNSNIAASEAAELEHKKTFDELMSDAKNEGIAASNQQHKRKSLEKQETKLSNDRFGKDPGVPQ